MDTLTLAILGATAIGLIAYSLFPRRGSERDTVKRRLSGQQAAETVTDIKEKAHRSATEQLMRRATPVLSRLIMPSSDGKQSSLRIKLMGAGHRHPQAQTVFLGSKTVLGVLGLILTLLIALSTRMPLTSLLGLAAFGAGAGFMLPNLWLMLAISGRQQRLRHGLPDTLDLLVVSVESGLGLDAALKRVGEEMALVHEDLSEELRIATMEAQMGIPRAEALENMAQRCGIEELRTLVSVIVQAEKFGTSIAKALRNQADSIRTKRRQLAEERAQKTAVKLMLPLVLFIFPAMGVVLGGPAALRMLRAVQENPNLGG